MVYSPDFMVNLVLKVRGTEGGREIHPAGEISKVRLECLPVILDSGGRAPTPRVQKV